MLEKKFFFAFCLGAKIKVKFCFDVNTCVKEEEKTFLLLVNNN